MRYAGQRFRLPGVRMPNQRADSGSISDYSAPVNVQGISSPRTNMPEANPTGKAFTAMPEIGMSPYNLPEFNEPEFQAKRRI